MSGMISAEEFVARAKLSTKHRYRERSVYSDEHRLLLSKGHLRAKLRKLNGRGHPLVMQLYQILLESDMRMVDVSVIAGINCQSIGRWHEVSPLLPLFEAAANALGYELRLVRKAT